MDKILEFKNVDFFYHTKEKEIKALENLNFSVNKNDFVSIVGPSGCGKTTLLSLTAGLLTASSGEILLNQKQIEKNDNRIGYMFQRDHLFDWRTIWKNITLGMEIQKPSDKDRKLEKAENLLKKYDLFAFRNQKPRQLSGGMRQRVALIRTLVMEKELLLLDEPFSALDFQTRLLLCDDVFEMIKCENATALLVTHDISEAISLSEKVVVLTKRPATVKTVVDINIKGKSPLKRREDSAFAQNFDSIWNLLKKHENKK